MCILLAFFPKILTKKRRIHTKNKRNLTKNTKVQRTQRGKKGVLYASEAGNYTTR
jgi:hypothetical protein